MDTDYYTRDSKIREILEILKPPVTRNYHNSYQDYIGYAISDSDRREKTNLAQNKFNKKKTQRAVKSSLSLILQKICKKQIFEEYPFSTNNSQEENQPEETNPQTRPTIKVTVIPKRDPNCLYEFLETQNQTTRKNKKDNTSCNDGNSIATKNIYLVVAGKKNDKIYELKANKTFKDKSKDVRFDNKRFPSKMDKKKKKSLKLEGKLDEQKCSNANCFCRCPKDDLDLSLEDEYPTGSSRVRIIGRIGLNKDDKYVMKCAATVNGQPVKTNYGPIHITTPGMPEQINDAERDTNAEKLPVHFSFSNDQFYEPTNESTTSQATQVDASIQLRKLHPTNDRNTQCNLCELCNTTEISNVGDESKLSNLNRSTSPLVIISVYPKPELKTFAINSMDMTSMNRFDTQHYRSPQLCETGRINKFAVNTELYNVRDLSLNKASTSRCCPCETVINNDTKTVTDDTKATNTNISKPNRASRLVSPVKKSSKSKTQERKKDLTDTYTAKPKSRSPSPNRLNTNDKINQRDTTLLKQTKKVGTLPKRTDTRKKQNETPTSKSKARDKSVNTVKEQSDKLKKVTENKKKSIPKSKMVKNDDNPTCRETVLKKYHPKNEISTVSINIDSEREFYDVVFEKGKVSTDLIVRRTAKDINHSSKYFEETFEHNYEKNAVRHSDSLENFFPLPGKGQQRRSASQAFNNENTDVFSPMSRLNVRDSLEIGHRKDHSKDFKSHASKHRFGNDTEGDNENKFYSPTKHFPGDDCIIDPVERDKEIRELLGVDKKRTDKILTADIFERNTYRNNSISRRCIFHNTMCKSLAKKPILHWSYSSCAENHLNDNNIHIPIRDEEKSITDDEKHKLIKLGMCTKIKKRNVSIQNKVKIAVMTKPQSTQYIAQEMLNQQRSNKDINLPPREKQKNILLSRKQYRKIKKLMHKVNGDWKKGRHVWNSSIVSVGSVRAKRRSEYLIYYNKDVQTDSHQINLKRSQPKIKDLKNAGDNHTVVLFCKEEPDKVKHSSRNENSENRMRKVASSIEIRYTSIAYSNRGEYSLERNRSNIIWKRPDSIETIFRGHKKTFTPNLGTSSISLLSDEMKLTAESLPTDSKPRKPFLRRLMSCLVMRSQTAAVKVPIVKPKPPTLDSSVDSYHISTSLGAMDMSSSIYDTSVSFYSNHTIGAINNKNKRGFFNSVREFLSPKKN